MSSCNPGGTSRQLTTAELEYQRDVRLPDVLINLSQQRGMLATARELRAVLVAAGCASG